MFHDYRHKKDPKRFVVLDPETQKVSSHSGLEAPTLPLDPSEWDDTGPQKPFIPRVKSAPGSKRQKQQYNNFIRAGYTDAQAREATGYRG